jgi:hypothetical protein
MVEGIIPCNPARHKEKPLRAISSAAEDGGRKSDPSSAVRRAVDRLVQDFQALEVGGEGMVW